MTLTAEVAVPYRPRKDYQQSLPRLRPARLDYRSFLKHQRTICALGTVVALEAVRRLSMQISQRPLLAVVIGTFALFVCGPASSGAQQPEPLRLSAPPAHSLVHADPQAQAQVQTQTAQGELLDVDGKANTLTIKSQVGEMTFRYNDQTRVTGAQKGVTGLATMTGSQVRVMYQKEGQNNIATTIDVKANNPAK
jgi:hypothetical protein